MLNTYLDLAKQAHHGKPYGISEKALAWTVNYETGVFPVGEQIHPKAAHVWLQYFPFSTASGHTDLGAFIEKWQRRGDEWECVEKSLGKVHFVNHNPFDPRKDLAASNTAKSVFPQNRTGDLCIPR